MILILLLFYLIKMPLCTIEHIRAAENACSWAAAHCEGESLVNFYKLYYCALHENLAVMIILAVFLRNL